MHYEKLGGGRCKCGLCPHECLISEGGHGRCRVRANNGGEIFLMNYAQISGAALDPIEKKPLKRFHPGSFVLSIGSYGCNLSCPFCQNHSISMKKPQTQECSPDEMAKLAKAYVKDGSIGLAYTYNEPLIGYEYVLDCARKVRDEGLLNVLVTNGCIKEEPFRNIIRLFDAANIDLKGSEGFYKKIGGDARAVKANIAEAAQICHVEVTELIIPGENDSDEEMEETASFLAGIGKSIPLHITRFFPNYLYSNRKATPRETVLRLKAIAEKRLEFVYAGNMA
jgi:pyruvate formate lyase activating enzyme